MSFGISIPLIAVARPKGFGGRIDLTEMAQSYGTLSERIPGGIDRLKDHLIDTHEKFHFLDIFSTPIGCCIFLLDNIRISASLNLFKAIKRYPISAPIYLPLADHILRLKDVDPVLQYIARDAVRLRNAADFLKLIYYGSQEPYGYRVEPKQDGINRAASLIPIFNRHYFYPILPEDAQVYTEDFPFDTHDIFEALALFSECTWIDITNVAKDMRERDRILGLFPRKPTASLLFTQISHLPCLKESLLHRYVLWKALLGLTCFPNSFDHRYQAHIPFYLQHPSLRLKRLWQVLSENKIKIPSFRPYLDKINILLEFDQDLSKKAGLETLTYSRDTFLSFQQNSAWSKLNEVEETIFNDFRPYYTHLSKIFFSIWNNIEDFICYSLIGVKFSKSEKDISMTKKWQNEATPFLRTDPTGVVATGRDSGEQKLNLSMSLIRLLALELDSFLPFGLFERYAGSIIFKEPNAHLSSENGIPREEVEILKNSICTGISSYKSCQIEWHNRLTMPITERFKF